MSEFESDLVEELRKIRFARFCMELEAETRLKLPSYKGSTFRGAFGNTFKRMVCVKRDLDCASCLIRHQCVYQYVFETPAAPEENMRKYTFAPHPFVIEPPQEAKEIYEPGERIEVGVVLIGQALNQLPYFIYAFDEMGRRGMGQGRGRTFLKRVLTRDSAGEERCIYRADEGQLDTDYAVYSGPSTECCVRDEVQLRLRTPLRLKSEGRLSRGIDFSLLVRSLLRRSADLARFHCGHELRVDFRHWINRAAGVSQARADLHWQDWERYSNRQQIRMKMGGLVGEVAYQGALEPFGPLLQLGADLHVGKGTGFGLGRYEVI